LRQIGVSNYSFSVGLAMLAGQEKALILSDICYWVNELRYKKDYQHDGRVWTYYSSRELHEKYPFWSQQKIKNMLKQMVNDGLLHVGVYNKIKYDQTRWYSPSDEVIKAYNSVVYLGTVDCTELNIQKDDSVQTIPDSISDSFSHTYAQVAEEQKEYEISFEKFWSEYPRKVNKGKTRGIWKKINPNAELLEKILNSLRAYKKTDQWTKDGGQYIPYPTTWLNGGRWEDELTVSNTSSSPDQPEPSNPWVNPQPTDESFLNELRKQSEADLDGE